MSASMWVPVVKPFFSDLFLFTHAMSFSPIARDLCVLSALVGSIRSWLLEATLPASIRGDVPSGT